MSSVGVRELKNKLSDYLGKVARGERITVTKRGKIVAVITPPVEDEVVRVISEMVREESASWSGGKPRGNTRPPKIKGKPLSETVLEERR